MYLGKKVKDLVSGFEGVVVGEIYYLNGCIQSEIKAQFLDKDMKIIEKFIDNQQLELLNDNFIVVPIEPTEAPFKLGQKVKDKVSGLTGIIIGIYTAISGQRRYGVKPKMKDDKVIDAVYVDEINLELLSTGLSEKLVQKKTGADYMPDAPVK